CWLMLMILSAMSTPASRAFLFAAASTRATDTARSSCNTSSSRIMAYLQRFRNLLRQREPPIQAGWEVHHLDDRVQVQRAVEVRIPLPVLGLLPADFGLHCRRVNAEQHQVPARPE